MSDAAGYSGTPLPRKLGIKAGHRVLLQGAPAGFELGPLPAGTRVHERAGRHSYDVVLTFCPDGAALDRALDSLLRRLAPASSLWVAWPKKASRLATDIDENAVRERGLAAGVVDVKVCAIDDVWSGLKFVYRLSDRSKVSSTQA